MGYGDDRVPAAICAVERFIDIIFILKIFLAMFTNPLSYAEYLKPQRKNNRLFYIVSGMKKKLKEVKGYLG